MTEEHVHHEHKKKLDVMAYFKSWRRIDWIALVLLIMFIVVMAVAVNLPKNGCEVARAGYKCETAKNVMVENCVFWGNYTCEHCTDWRDCSDPSLPEIEWYIGNLCEIHNRYHSDKLDCSNLRLACNQATGEATCTL